METPPNSLTDLPISPSQLQLYAISLGYRNRSVLAPYIFGSRLPGTGTVLVLAPCIFGSPFPRTGTVLVPTMPVPSILH